MSTLIVKLPQNPADVAALYEHVLTRDGRAAGDYSRAALALLPPADEVVVGVPIHMLSWHQVKLPPGLLGHGFLQEAGASRLRLVLEGLLEDRLLDEASHLHFALQPHARPASSAWVAVCDRDWLRAGLQALEQTGHTVTRIVPEYAPDSVSDALRVIGEPERALIVFSARDGIAVWPLSAASVALLNWPATAGVVAEPAVAKLAEELFKRRVTLQPSAKCCLQAAESSWDLAQFDFARSGGARTRRQLWQWLTNFMQAPRWRAVRIALLALLVLNLVGLNALAWKERATLDAKRSAIRHVLTSTFPKIKVVVDAPLQMEKEVAALRQASGAPSDHDLETMLSALGSAMPANKIPDVIDFVPGEARMKGLTLTPEQIAAISFKLRPKHYVVSAESHFLVIRHLDFQ
jgi:general secretion pathway protein L